MFEIIRKEKFRSNAAIYKIVLLLCCITLTGCNSQNAFIEPMALKNGTTYVSFDRAEDSVKDTDGNIYAEMYFLKPVLTGDAQGIPKINAYFDEEAKGFFDGSEHSRHFWVGGRSKFFGMNREEFLEYEYLIDDPFRYSCNTAIMYMDDNLISVRETTYWQHIGTDTKLIYAATFNLNTGELLDLEDFIVAKSDAFNERILYEIKSDLGDNYDYINEIAGIEERILNSSLEDYEFYYDGVSVFVIVNCAFNSRSAYVTQYNGEIKLPK